ncbi:MAG: hypothetical protein LQ343_007588 [Gyalolechia ehrenbergii]|nr:MAG: hypothetical protein LQ343_007588 [Gyalolechia ehrenbergii]
MHFTTTTLAALFLLYTAAFAALIPIFNPKDAAATEVDLTQLEDPNSPSNEEFGLQFAAQRENKAVAGLYSKE